MLGVWLESAQLKISLHFLGEIATWEIYEIFGNNDSNNIFAFACVFTVCCIFSLEKRSSDKVGGQVL